MSFGPGFLLGMLVTVLRLFPLPPLDGGRVLVGLLPHRLAYSLSRLEPWGFFIVLALVLVGIVGNYWLRPLISLGYIWIDFVLTPLTSLLL